MKKALLFLLLSALCLVSCKKDPIDPPDPPVITPQIIVVNEGVWNGSPPMSSLSAIFADGTVVPDAFEVANGTHTLGDTPQYISYIDGNYYVPVSNSGKVEVIDPETFKSVATILLSNTSQLDISPSYAVGIGNNEAIVSTHEALLRISTVDFTVKEVISALALGGWSEQMVVAGNKLFCAVWKPDLEYIGLDTSVGLAVFDLNNIADGAHRMVPDVAINNTTRTCKLIVDKNGKLWAVSSNDYVSLTLNRIDPVTERVEEKIEVVFAEKNAGNIGKITSVPYQPRVDTDRTRGKIYVTFYRLSDAAGTEELAVYTLDVNQTQIGAEPFRTMPDVAIMYGMGVSPDGQAVYICDCLQWGVERGKLRSYGPNGAGPTFSVGIYPREIYFTEYDQ